MTKLMKMVKENIKKMKTKTKPYKITKKPINLNQSFFIVIVWERLKEVSYISLN